MHWTEAEYAVYCSRQLPAPASQGVLREAAFLAQVRSIAHQHGWLTYHPYNSQRSEEGWPDLACCNGHRLVLTELKVGSRKPTAAQARWLEMLGHVETVESYLWYPSQLADITTILSHR